LQRHLKANERVQLADITERYSVLSLMGPEAGRIAGDAGIGELNDLAFYRHMQTEINGMKVRAARLSYVGEPGWEITCESTDSPNILATLLDAGAAPAGAYAQTSMRIEKGFLAYGHDLDTDINPLQAGLANTLDWQSDFIGKSALLKIRNHPVDTRIATIVFTDAESVPLGNEPVYSGERIIGKTTSACYGYRVDAPLALALVSTVPSTAPASVQVDIAGVRHNGRLIDGPALSP